MVEAGDYVKQGSPIIKISDLNTVWVVFDAYENQVAHLKEGQDIAIAIKAYPHKKFQARISFINPVMQSDTRTIEVRAVLQNPNGFLKPGMFALGLLEQVSPKGSSEIIVPESAVLWTGERSVVYIKTDPDNSSFEMREIVLGDFINDGYVVVSGLENGDEIVTNGTFTIDAAAQLKGKKSMMNKTGEGTMTGHEGHSQMDMD